MLPLYFASIQECSAVFPTLSSSENPGNILTETLASISKLCQLWIFSTYVLWLATWYFPYLTKERHKIRTFSLYFSLRYRSYTLSILQIGPGSITWLIGVWSSLIPSWHPRLASSSSSPLTITSWQHIINTGQPTPRTRHEMAQTRRLPRVNIAIIRIRRHREDLYTNLFLRSFWR